jgi:hypothetical protein
MKGSFYCVSTETMNLLFVVKCSYLPIRKKAFRISVLYRAKGDLLRPLVNRNLPLSIRT